MISNFKNSLKKGYQKLSNTKIKPIYILLLIVLLIAIGLRTYKLDKSIWLQVGYDESRDMLVAQHIVSGELIPRGPLAAGGMNQLMNSPLYYYFTALIWFYTRNPLIFMYIWALMMVAPVLIGYKIGKKTIDEKAGLILATIIAINHQMVASSRELLQPHLLLIFALSFIWAGISFIKSRKHKLRYLNLAIIFIFLPLHFHYGVLISIPFGIILLTYAWNCLYKEKISFHHLLSPIILLITVLASWVMLTYRKYPLDQFLFFTSNFETKYNRNPLNQIKESILTLYQLIWGNITFNSESVIFLIAFIFIFIKIKKHTKKELGLRKSIFFLLLMSSSIFFFVFYKHFVAATYLLFILPFFITILALGLRLILQKNRLFGIVVIIITITSMAATTYHRIFVNLPKTSFHNQQQEIAEQVYKHYQSLDYKIYDLNQPSLLISMYTTTQNMPFDGWGTSGVWFYLEKYFKQPLVENTSYGVNHKPINRFPKVIYMVCDHRVLPEMIDQECLQRFKNAYQLEDDKVILINKNLNLSLWGTLLNQNQKKLIRNVVHKELLN